MIPVDNLYAKIGANNIKLLVNEFYKLVFTNPKIKNLFQTNQEIIKDKQYKFLTQFFGGPNLYTEEFGAPKMRRRHIPHVITQESKEEWLKCMKEAIDTLPIEEELKAEIYKAFPILAQHMVNR